MERFLPYDDNATFTRDDIVAMLHTVAEQYKFRSNRSQPSHADVVGRFWISLRQALQNQQLDKTSVRIGSSGGAEYLQIKVSVWHLLQPAWDVVHTALGRDKKDKKATTAVPVSFTDKNRGRCNLIPIALVPADVKAIIRPTPKADASDHDDDKTEAADHAPLSESDGELDAKGTTLVLLVVPCIMVYFCVYM
jgi:hypothetical protein